jgi:GNAT superfamily N-acetyltransferase
VRGLFLRSPLFFWRRACWSFEALTRFSMFHFIPVDDPALIQRTVDLARRIWMEHYPSIVGEAQVEYMLGRFQTPDVIERQVRQEGYQYFLVTDGVRDVGYYAVQQRDHELFLSKFYLEQSSRGSGLARKMLASIEALAASRGLSRVALLTHKRNVVALKAYEGLGFKVVGPVVTDIGEGYVMDDYRLEKEI